MATPTAIILLSGGLDSAVCAWWAKDQGYDIHALSFSYGQRHSLELDLAARLAEKAGAMSHRVVNIDLGGFGGSTLTTTDEAVPQGDINAPVDSSQIPSTYVPMRNMVFLSIAASMAEAYAARTLIAGMNAVDYSGYPDCRPPFVDAVATACNLGSKIVAEGGPELSIETPLMTMDKPAIITLGRKLGVPFALTNSCYDPTASGAPCGTCDSCRIRHQAFKQCQIPDPREL